MRHAVLLESASVRPLRLWPLFPAVCYRLIWNPLLRYYRSVLLICPHPCGYYCGNRGITAVAVTVSSTSLDTHPKVWNYWWQNIEQQHQCKMLNYHFQLRNIWQTAFFMWNLNFLLYVAYFGCIGYCKFVRITWMYFVWNLLHFVVRHVIGECRFGAACKFSHLTPADKDALVAASKFNHAVLVFCINCFAYIQHTVFRQWIYQ